MMNTSAWPVSACVPPPPRLGAAPKVLLVDDHALCRMGTRALIDSADIGEVIEWIEASTLHEALQLHADNPTVSLVLLDLNLSDCKGLQGLSQFLALHPDARVVILSGTQDEFVVRQAKVMGAAGYLYKGSAPTLTRDALLDLVAGAVGASQHGSTHFPKCAPTSKYDLVAELGPRHLDILELVLSGCSNQEISSSTRLSLGTVKNYVSTILLALDVKSRSHLISLFR